MTSVTPSAPSGHLPPSPDLLPPAPDIGSSLSQSEARIITLWPIRGWGWSLGYNGLCTTRWWDERPGTEPRGVSPPRVKVSHHAPSGVLSVVCPVAPVVSDQLSALDSRNTPTPKLWPDITHLAINNRRISSPALIRQNEYLLSLSLTLLPDFCAHISQCGNLKSVSLANAQEILIPKFCNVLINWRKQLAPLVVYSSKRFGLITLHFRSLTLLWRRLEPLWGVMTQLPLPLPQSCSGIYLASFLTVDNMSSKEIFVHCLTFTNKT